MNDSYIKYVKELDEILPNTNKIDYTKTNPDDIIENLENFIYKIFGKYKEDNSDVIYGYNSYNDEINRKVEDVLSTAKRNLKEIYGKDHFAISNNDSSKGFDQNNYMIKGNISNIKVVIMRLLNEHFNLHLTNEEYEANVNTLAYTDKMGTDEEIKSFINEDEIMNYLKNLVSNITCEQNDIINDQMLDYMAEEVALRYGVDADVIENILEDVKKISNNYSSENIYMDGISGIQISSTNISTFQKNIENSLRKIMNYIKTNSDKRLSIKVAYDGFKRGTRSNSSTVNPSSEKKPRNDEQSSKDPISEEKTQSIFDKYAKIEALIGENRKLVRQIEKLKEQIEKNDKIIAETSAGIIKR